MVYVQNVKVDYEDGKEYIKIKNDRHLSHFVLNTKTTNQLCFLYIILPLAHFYCLRLKDCEVADAEKVMLNESRANQQQTKAVIDECESKVGELQVRVI